MTGTRERGSAPADVVEIPLDERSVLLRPSTGQRLLVNSTALEAWHELRAGADDADAVAAVARRHGLSAELVAGDVLAALAVLRPFAAGAGAPPSVAPPSVDGSSPWRHRPGRVRSSAIDSWRWTGTVGPFSALGHRFVVRADDPTTLELASTLFGSLLEGPDAASGPATGDVLVTYSIRSRGDRHLGAALWRDDQPIRFAPDGEGAVARLAWLVNGAAVDQPRAGLAFHAAAVAHEGQVVLLAGASGAGKSTLAAALVVHGLDYLGDEVTVVDAGHTVTGMPRAAGLSSRSLDAIGLDPTAAVWLGDDGHVPPEGLRSGSARTSGRLAAVVLPRFRAGGTWTATRLGPTDAVGALLPCVFGSRPFTQGDAAVLGSIATTVPVHRIELADGPTAVSFVARLVTSS